MFPNRLKSALPALIAATLVSACGGGGGSASAMPENFQVVEGDSQVTITWKQEAGVQYWLFYAPSTTDITVESWKKTAGALSKIGDRGKGISSPYVITGLTNDKSYDFLLNGRTDGGEGGPTASLSPKTPRLSGSTWLTGKPLSSGTPLLSDKLMRSLAYGLTASGASTYSYVAVGHGGKIYKTPDTDGERSYGAIETTSTASVLQPLNWTSPTGTQVSSGIDLKGIVYATGLAKYIAVGTAGSVAYSSDINNWTTLDSSTTATSNTLNAVANNGSSLVVAVGDNGTIRYSTDGTTWTAANAITPATSANLYGVAYSAKGEWVAVGDGGTVLTSTDGSNWTATTQSGALKSVAAVTHVANSVITYAFVAVGSDGTVLTRTDDNAWTAETLAGSFYAASAGSRLVAAGTSGAIFTCEIPCVSWAVPPTKPTTAETIYGLLNAQNTYTAVGSNSLSIYSY